MKPAQFLRICIIVYIVAACREKIAFNNLPAATATYAPIRNWLISAPIYIDSALTVPGEFIGDNSLKPAGLNDQALTSSEFDAVAEKLTAAGIPLVQDTNRAPYINLAGTQTDKKPAVRYLFTTIEAPEDTSLALLVHAAQHCRIWINGEHVYTTIAKQYQRKYHEEYIPVRLRKGSNRIHVKVGIQDFSSTIHHWEFTAALAPDQYARESYVKEYAFDFLACSIIGTVRHADIYLGPYAGKAPLPYTLKNLSGDVLKQGRLSATAGAESMTGFARLALPDSFHQQFLQLEIHAGETTLRQDFFYGDFNILLKETDSLYWAYLPEFTDIATQRDFAATYQRLKRLAVSNATGFEATVRFWDRSRVLAGIELMKFRDARQKEKSADKGFRFRLNSFVSGIDGSVQFYLLHMPPPSITPGKKTPLVIMLPFPSAGDTPLEFSWRISNSDEILWTARSANEKGFAVLWADLRGLPGNTALNSADLVETLLNAQQRHDIDPDRVFLLGASASANTALLYALLRPDLFSGCALINPILSDSETLRENEKHKHPFALQTNLSQSHVFIKCSLHDEKVPVKTVQKIFNEHFAGSRSSNLVISSQGTHFASPADYLEDAFRFFADKKRLPLPDTLRFTTYSHLHTGYGWLRIHPDSCGATATAEAYVSSNSIHVQTANVRQLEIIRQALPPHAWPYPVYVNGKLANGAHDTASNISRYRFSAHRTDPGHTIDEVFSGPFLLVENEENKLLADSIALLWERKNWSLCPRIHEKDLQPEILATHHMIIPGTPVSIRRVMKNLRFQNTSGENQLEAGILNSPFADDKLVLYISTPQIPHPLPFTDLTLFRNARQLIYHAPKPQQPSARSRHR